MDHISLHFEAIKSSNAVLFKVINNILEKSFVPDERRDYDDKLLSRTDFQLNAVILNEVCIGLLADWNFNDFILIEHIAIDEKFRNKGLGSAILQNFFQQHASQIILMEAKPPHTEIDHRRLELYQRTGMKINSFDYIQPAYDAAKSPVPMLILSYPHQLTLAEYERMKKIIYLNVYGYS